MSTYKILCIGDPHFESSIINRNMKMANQTIEVAKKYNPDIIVILGDLLDKFGKDPNNPRTEAFNFTENLAKITTTFLIIGNHERDNNSDFLSNKHPYHGWKYVPNLIIIDKPLRYEYKNDFFVFCPYVPKDKLIEALNHIEDWKNARTVFCHNDIDGFCYTKDIIVENADKWLPTYPLSISGHIHTYSHYLDNWWYPGTSIQTRRGEELDKALALYTYNVDDKNYPQELRIPINVEKYIDLNMTVEEFNNYNHVNNGDNYKITIKDSNENFTKLNSEKLNLLKSQGVSIKRISEGVKKVYMDCSKPYDELVRQHCNNDMLNLFTQLINDNHYF